MSEKIIIDDLKVIKKTNLEANGSSTGRSDVMLDTCQESPIQNKSQYSMHQSMTRQEES